MTTERSKGFTLIETLIVLAVAGLILSIVLFFIPQLQRVARNNVRKQDVNIILDNLATYLTNNSGTMPNQPAFLQTSKIKYYDTSNISFTSDVTAGISIRVEQYGRADVPTSNNSTDSVWIYNYRKCLSTGTGSTSNSAGYRDIVAVFGLESPSGPSPKCQQL